jgi:hypothetical protein
MRVAAGQGEKPPRGGTIPMDQACTYAEDSLAPHTHKAYTNILTVPFATLSFDPWHCSILMSINECILLVRVRH